jgi:ABC-type polysaccharide/polyol phosphate export permease
VRYREAAMTRLKEYAGGRELLANLTLRELRGKYKRSFLGWGWSLLNPLASIAIYWLVFGIFLKIDPPTGDPSGLSSFALFLVCGLLPWTFFQMGVESSPDTLISNGNLIKKVYFPREILVVASTASILVNFGIELVVLGVLLLIVGNMVLPWIPVLLVLVAIQFVLVLGLALLLSVLNVYFRDVKHFVSLAMKILFYTVPVVYPLSLVPKHKEVAGMSIPVRQIYELNPLVAMVECYRAVLYDLRFPSFGDFAYFLVWALALFAFGWWVFSKLEPRLAEEV